MFCASVAKWTSGNPSPTRKTGTPLIFYLLPVVSLPPPTTRPYLLLPADAGDRLKPPLPTVAPVLEVGYVVGDFKNEL